MQLNKVAMYCFFIIHYYTEKAHTLIKQDGNDMGQKTLYNMGNVCEVMSFVIYNISYILLSSVEMAQVKPDACFSLTRNIHLELCWEIKYIFSQFNRV